MFPDYVETFNMHKQSVQPVELHKGKNVFIRMFMTDIAQGAISQCMNALLENFLLWVVKRYPVSHVAVVFRYRIG